MTKDSAREVVGGAHGLSCTRCRRPLSEPPTTAGFCERCEVEYFTLRDQLSLRWWFVLGASVPCGLTYWLVALMLGARGGGTHGFGVLAPIAVVMAAVACGKAAVFLRCRALQRSLARGDTL